MLHESRRKKVANRTIQGNKSNANAGGDQTLCKNMKKAGAEWAKPRCFLPGRRAGHNIPSSSLSSCDPAFAAQYGNYPRAQMVQGNFEPQEVCFGGEH